jgi:hypothetical protein
MSRLQERPMWSCGQIGDQSQSPAQGEGSWVALPFHGNFNSMSGPDTREYVPQQEMPRGLLLRKQREAV